MAGDFVSKSISYENMPLWIVLISNLLALSIYAIGIYIVSRFGVLFVILYLLYIIWIEVRLLKGSCVDCYYYDKICAFGRGKLCSLFFKNGNPKKFVEKEIKKIDLVPDFLVSIIPMVFGIILLVTDFSWTILALLIILSILSFGGNAFVRGSLACKYCKQREIGCPALEVFSKQR
jgi:hypothetical protein